jgi:hypothetical protein
MRREIWILPVGLEYDRVLESLKLGGRDVHILYSDTADGVSSASRGFAERVRAYLQQGPFSVRGFTGVDVLDLGACIRAIKAIVKLEREAGDDPLFRINVGTSSKIMTMASLYVAAQEPFAFELHYPRAKNYVIMDVIEAAEALADASTKGRSVEKHIERLTQQIAAYRNSGGTTRQQGGYGMLSVPVIPMQRLSRTQEAIMRALFESDRSFESASALAEFLFEDSETLGAEKVQGAKSSVSFALQALLTFNLVELRPVRNRKEVHLSEAGRLYCQVFLDDPTRAADAATSEASSAASRKRSELA